jgi:membrane protease YdiL (CAAX protease family)
MIQPTDLSSKPGRIAVSSVFIIAFTVLLMLGSFVKAFTPDRFDRLAYGLVGTVLAFGLTLAFLRWEKQVLSWIGLVWEARTPIRFLMGLGMGIVLTAVIMAFVAGYANVGIVRNTAFKPDAFLIGCISIFFLAWMEEIAFRGYPLVTLQRTSGIWTTQIVIAILFASYHVAGGWDAKYAILGPGAWSLIFSLAAIRSKGIAMSTGIHVAANLVQSSIGEGDFAFWSMQPSASDIPTMMQQIKYGGIMTQVGILLTGIALTWVYVRRRF